MKPPSTIVAMASGGGRTVLNLRRFIGKGPLSDVSMDHVFVSRPDAAAVDRCRAEGMQVHLPAGDVDAEAAAFLKSTEPDMVLLCGYLRFLHIESPLHHRVLNIHPALLPDHGGPGMFGHHVHTAVLASGDEVSGCTVHLVDDGYDQGPIVLQRTCPVLEGDDCDALAARVFAEECRAFPDALTLAVEGRLRLRADGVEIAGEGDRWPQPLFWRT